jgi:hypothetical protein
MSPEQQQRIGECPMDMGGYFVINGSEKVLIAQERMAGNYVYVFEKAQPSNVSHVAELTSVLSTSGMSKMSKMVVKLFTAKGDKQVSPEKFVWGYKRILIRCGNPDRKQCHSSDTALRQARHPHLHHLPSDGYHSR